MTGWSKAGPVVGAKHATSPSLRPHGLISHAWRWGAGVISAGAGLVSILSYTHSMKAKFDPDSVAVSGVTAVRWVGVSPTLDSASSLGDTINLAVTATDPRGNALLGAPTQWSTSDSIVASVDSAGTVVARSAGTAAITVTVGRKTATAHVVVRQDPAEVRIVGDSIIRVPEGERGQVVGYVADARRQKILGLAVRWRSADPSVAAVDSVGNLTGVAPGRTTFTATHEGMVTQLPAEVYPVPASLTLISGDGQRAPAGRRVANPVAVQVVSRSGRPIEGVPVRFALPEGAGQTDPQSGNSDAQGIVRATWTLAGVPGRQSLGVSADGVASHTVVTAEAEPVGANTRLAQVNENLEGPAGGPLADPVVVRVTDSSGVALADVPVAWSADDDGSIVASESRTDSLGEARSRWTLGPKSGAQRAYVQVGSPRAVPRFVVRATAKAGRAATVAVVAVSKREGSVSKVLKPSVELRVLDRAKNPVPGVAISLLPAHGSVDDSILTTDSTGRVLLSWTLGRTAGLHRMSARVEGIERPVEITARARPAAPANLAFVEPKPGTANRAVQSLDVDLTDAYGNPVADQPVVFSTKVGNVSPARVMTDARGRAHTRWTPGSKVGARTLVAAVKGTEARATFVLKAPEPATPAKKPVPSGKETPAKKPVVKRAAH
ncbi:MAG TPA: Ig-like domain-containing protein [Gemmatimonadales bacterium]|nr:Ig-like domain-containing protein [Gemmatimonadales bacterium]